VTMMAPVAVALQRQLREAGAVCAETPRETVFQASSDCWYALQGSTSVRTAGAPCMEVLPFGLLVRPAGKHFRSACCCC